MLVLSEAAPPPALSVADGVLAALAFFVLQAVYYLLLGDAASFGQSLAVSFVASGATVAVVSLWYFRRAGLPHLRRTLGLRRPELASGALVALASGAAAGVGAAGVALGYLKLVRGSPFLRQLLQGPELVGLDGVTRVWLVVLAVAAAPLAEEFIFRGILFSAFRRSLGTTAAAFASAAVFGLVHPPHSALPVFVLGFVAALVYARFRWLGAPIAAHAVYNALVVGLQLGL